MNSARISAAEIAATSHVYTMLARTWLREVDPSLVQLLAETEFGEAWRAAGGVIPSLDEMEDLATEYCRLFIGPKNHLPPFQSVWEAGQLQTEIASSVGRFADLLHYQLPPAYPGTLIDHLGMQLNIMGDAMLRFSNEKLWESEGLASEIVREFYKRHLTWPGRLLKAGAEQASSDFYRSMIGLTERFLQSQRDIWLRST